MAPLSGGPFGRFGKRVSVRIVTRPLSFVLGALLLTVAMVACGGQGVNAPSITSAQTVMSSTTGSTTMPLASVSGFSALTVLPPTNVAANITEVLSTSTFSGTPALGAARSAQSAVRVPQALTQTDFLYIEFVSSTSVTLNGTPAMSITLPSIATGATYFLAEYNATGGWQAPVAGPGTVSG